MVSGMEREDRIALNLRREFNRRIRFVKQRMREMPVELRFAQGKLNALPERITLPPEWALASARLWAVGFFRPMSELIPREGQKYDPLKLVEFTGCFHAMVSFVSHPSQALLDEEKELPVEITDMRLKLAGRLEKGFVHFVSRILAKLPRIEGLPSAEQQKVVNERYNRGLGAFRTRPDLIVGCMNSTVTLYHVIWMFWPSLKEHFTAPYIHSWFKRELGQSTSDKTVEAVVTSIHKESQATLIASAG